LKKNKNLILIRTATPPPPPTRMKKTSHHPQHQQQTTTTTQQTTITANVSTTGDSFFTFESTELDAIRQSKPWTGDARYFKRVHVSAAAAMKMMAHAVAGVERGAAVGGKPFECMGLLFGRPGTVEKTSLIVTDSFPLPVEGAETKVLADDQAVINYMIALGESLEKTRRERFMGWYHSHPFDVGVLSHCYLSQTDISTQLQWQRSEDPFGNPWLAIVVDPLRSLAKGKPELGAFRVYPPEYNPPSNLTPDGQLITDNAARIERWGVAWNRYHSLEVNYFASQISTDVVTAVSQMVLWKGALSTTPINDRENRERFHERVKAAADRLERSEIKSGIEMSLMRGTLRIGSGGGSSSMPNSSSNNNSSGGGGGDGSGEKGGNSLDKVAKSTAEIAIEQDQGHLSQTVKRILFGT
jgi:COP9 signalosome complex subunit 5